MKNKFIPPTTTERYITLPKTFEATYDESEHRISISSPDVLCVYTKENSYVTYRFVQYIETVIFEYGLAINISFKELKSITAAASLLVFARITKCQLCLKLPTDLSIITPDDKGMKQLFSNSGFWSGIKPGGVSKIRKLIDSNNQYMSGSNSIVEHPAKVISATVINLALRGVKFSSPSTHLFTRGIQEAILNVDYHAYNEDSFANVYKDIGDSRWWQCSWLDKENSQLVFIIYDDGMGIAPTLKAQFPNLPTHEVIKEAMKVGTTRTLNPERGKGSNDIIKATCTFPNSHLVVMSGDGYYKHDANNVTSEKLPFTLEGTLVQWVLDYTDENSDDNV